MLRQTDDMWTRLCLLSVWPSCLACYTPGAPNNPNLFPKKTSRRLTRAPPQRKKTKERKKLGNLTGRITGKTKKKESVCVHECARCMFLSCFVFFVFLVGRGGGSSLGLFETVLCDTQVHTRPAKRQCERSWKLRCTVQQILSHTHTHTHTEKDTFPPLQHGDRTRQERRSYLCNEQHMSGPSLEMFFLWTEGEKNKVLLCVCAPRRLSRLILQINNGWVFLFF